MKDNDLISRQSLLNSLNRFAPEHFNALVNDLIMKEPAATFPQAIENDHFADGGKMVDDCISRKALKESLLIEDYKIHDYCFPCKTIMKKIDEQPSTQPQYEELTPEEAASEIASGSTMSAWYWLDDMIRLKQMGYVICRKK